MLADLLVFYCRLTGLSLVEVPLAVELIAEEVTWVPLAISAAEDASGWLARTLLYSRLEPLAEDRAGFAA